MSIAILVNPNCAGHKGLLRWQLLLPHLRKTLDFEDTNVFVYSNADFESKVEVWVRHYLGRGFKNFLAVGGDGTLNLLLNSLIRNSNTLESIRLGAIGIGSSNDFHKPFQKRILGFPCRFDFENAAASDLIQVNDLKNENSFYFLINASLGITAAANFLFNNPDPFLRKLKQIHSGASIFYSAITMLIRFRNIPVEITDEKGVTCVMMISNLGIVKNRHFSGSFRYDQGAENDRGNFCIHISYDMNRLEKLKSLVALAQGKFTGRPKTRTFRTSFLHLKSSIPFSLECDGELVETNNVQIGIFPERIHLCPP